MSEHRCLDIEGDGGDACGLCSCGWSTGLVGDDEQAIDLLMEHAAAMARDEFVRFGTWLNPAFYTDQYDHFTGTFAGHVPGVTLPLYRRLEETP